MLHPSTGGEIDKFITLDIPSRGVIHRLYEAARNLTQTPLCLCAADRLKGKVKPGSNVFIVCDFPIGPTFSQETDGPVGAGALARVLRLGLGASPIVVTAPGAIKIAAAACSAMGLQVVDSNQLSEVESSSAILTLPTDDLSARVHSHVLVEEFHPAAILFIEAAGKNEKGVYHNMRGLDISEHVAK
jgi:hypothetical protein